MFDDELRKRENEIAKLHKSLEEAKPRWIPCSEELPEDDFMVLVTYSPKNGEPNVNRAYFDGMYWHGSGSMSTVTAWMPLPEPYKEGSN